VRYSSFTHHNVPFAVTVFTDMIYLSSGLLNVLLFSITRPFLLPHDLPKPEEAPQIVIPRIRITTSLHSDSTHEECQGDEWPRFESPVSHIQPDYIGDMSTKGSETPWYGNEKRNRSLHSLEV
jgi:hypothetical protein